jgi:SpoVK/Ycf46/Vps4 family AAA+-type ATPase
MTTLPKPYKLRAFKFFDTLDLLASKEPRYRSVFDQSELAYLWGELSLVNKLFDEGDWKAQYEFRIFDRGGQQLGRVGDTVDVPRDREVVYLRHGWGKAAKGAYWTKGRYRWEAWLNGEKLQEGWVAVVADGRVVGRQNPYFEPVSLGLYEGPAGALPAASRRYLSDFDAKTTRYVHCHFVARNRKRDEAWPCEVFVNFFFDTGELSCRSQVVREVAPTDELIEIEVHWGNEKPGVAWFPDQYRVEVVFMDHLIATHPFTVGEGAVEAPAGAQAFARAAASRPTAVHDQPESLEDALKALDELVGLERVKARIRQLAHYQGFVQLRRQRGFREGVRLNLHAAFVGNPGTGKTTVARLMGRIYRRLGLLSRGHLVEVGRGQLVGQYIGHTAPMVQALLAKARGGVLFIDEAYALFRGAEESARDYGREVLEVLVTEMSDGPGDLAIIFAGYPAEMRIFLDGNPGLRSRIGEILEFDDYLPHELQAIAELTATKAEVTFAPAAREFLAKRLVDLYRGRDRTFGNARDVADLVTEALINLGVRVRQHGDPGSLGREELSTLQLEDVQRVFAARRRPVVAIPIDEELLADSLAELRGLVGLGEIKQEIDELVRLARFYREARKEQDLAGLVSHAVLTGNPGTGKTTVARLLGRIYRALGLLERGHLVECDRSGLVAGYVGQTALKTGRAVAEAMGGVLFVDEAYALARDRHADHGFGAEALEVLVKRMEDDRGEFVLMVAGYTDLMEEFLDANPGLRSRFGRVLHFPDYGGEELYEIGLGLLARRGLTARPDARDRLRERCLGLARARGPGFGNAREVRRLVEAVVRQQHLRLAALAGEARTPDALTAVLPADVDTAPAPPAPPGARPPGGTYL